MPPAFKRRTTSPCSESAGVPGLRPGVISRQGCWSLLVLNRRLHSDATQARRYLFAPLAFALVHSLCAQALSLTPISLSCGLLTTHPWLHPTRNTNSSSGPEQITCQRHALSTYSLARLLSFTSGADFRRTSPTRPLHSLHPFATLHTLAMASPSDMLLRRDLSIEDKFEQLMSNNPLGATVRHPP